jgi:hypothetical protein
MKRITEETELLVGYKLLWENSPGRRELFGEFSVVSIHHHGSEFQQHFYLRFPDKEIPQFMDRHSILIQSKLINENEDPEYFL